MGPVDRIVLIGLSGSGKSTVAALLAKRLGWTRADTDAAVEAALGRSVPEIFARDGEAAFRAAERQALAAALARDRVAVATGGGAVVADDAWGPDLLARPGTLVVALDVEPATALARLRRQVAEAGAVAERPLLAGPDPLARLTELKRRRQAAYDRAALTLIVDRAPAETIAAEIAALLSDAADDEPNVRLRTPAVESAIDIRPGALAWLGRRPRARWPAARRAWLLSDDRVGPLHVPAAAASLAAAGLAVRTCAVPAGESSKSWAVAGTVLDWLLDAGVERGDVLVALGGGVVGDLGGFVAAIALRGIGLVQVPTSLLAMVDSSVGGKTGINHRAGKNLIGAFYQPPLVVIDPTLLATLPPRELTAGWAEVVKHALIQPSTPGGERADLEAFLERNASALLARREPALTYLIRRNVALKAAVVTEDERETGIRAHLNYGHTLGHAIEAAGYRYLHGEAVALGLRAAARLGAALGHVDQSYVARVDALLDRFGLPDRAAVDPDRVLALLGSDKKRAAGKQRWVLPLAAGGVALRDDVPPAAVRAALAAIVSPPED